MLVYVRTSTDHFVVVLNEPPTRTNRPIKKQMTRPPPPKIFPTHLPEDHEGQLALANARIHLSRLSRFNLVLILHKRVGDVWETDMVTSNTTEHTISIDLSKSMSDPPRLWIYIEDLDPFEVCVDNPAQEYRIYISQCIIRRKGPSLFVGKNYARAMHIPVGNIIFLMHSLTNIKSTPDGQTQSS